MSHPAGLKPLDPGSADLFAAVRKGTAREVMALLGKGVNPNTCDPLTKNTVLLVAAALNRLSIAKALLEAGANPNQGTALDTLPLHLAVAPLQDRHGNVRAPNLRMAHLLLSFGADASARDADGLSALQLAAEPEKFARLLARRLGKQLPPARGLAPPIDRL